MVVNVVVYVVLCILILLFRKLQSMGDIVFDVIVFVQKIVNVCLVCLGVDIFGMVLYSIDEVLFSIMFRIGSSIMVGVSGRYIIVMMYVVVLFFVNSIVLIIFMCVLSQLYMNLLVVLLMKMSVRVVFSS